jgi:fructose-bisphosphate aldolase class I
LDLSALNQMALRLVAPGKGLLAADESTGTIKKRFDAVGVENTETNRRDYRELMFRAADAMADISGVILFDETLYQNAADGTPMVELIAAAGAVPGIKVDEGTVPLPGFPGETITEGLDGLAARLDQAYARGARFAKWRAVFTIGDGIPSGGAVHANAHALARYAALCQAHNIVPIVEPEVLMDGDHDIGRCEDVTRMVHHAVFDQLHHQRVALEGMLLKPNMILSGLDCTVQASVEEAAQRTIAVLKAGTPAAVPGVVFLSGGQTDLQATAHLDAMNRIGGCPWPLSFSYGRALQGAAEAAWAGKPENAAAAQRAFTHRARMNSLASLGAWPPALEDEAVI